MNNLVLGSKGPYVKLVQSLLIRLGYQPGPVDGIYGPITQSAVKAFQTDVGLVPDGIVGPLTFSAFEQFLDGVDSVEIQPNDTYFKLAKQYYTTVNEIQAANPDVDPNNLMIGQIIQVPFGFDVVFTDIDYTYEILERNLNALKKRYPFLEIGIFGKSVLGKNLYFLKLGKGEQKVHYNAAHHSLEWITSPLLMHFAERYLKAYVNHKSLSGVDTQELWNNTSIYITPMLNPDGVDLVLEGLSDDNPYYDDLLLWNNTGKPFSEVWQANIRGVDLNRNYPAGWLEAKEQEPSLGVFGPGPTRYGGPTPLSEPETQALVEFTKKHDFRLVIAYHSQGRVIYWTYKDIIPPDAFKIAQIFSELSGYAVSDVPYEASFAGYKDYFIDQFFKPGYTIEVGLGKNPLPIQQFPRIYDENEAILLTAPTL